MGSTPNRLIRFAPIQCRPADPKLPKNKIKKSKGKIYPQKKTQILFKGQMILDRR